MADFGVLDTSGRFWSLDTSGRGDDILLRTLIADICFWPIYAFGCQRLIFWILFWTPGQYLISGTNG